MLHTIVFILTNLRLSHRSVFTDFHFTILVCSKLVWRLLHVTRFRKELEVVEEVGPVVQITFQNVAKFLTCVNKDYQVDDGAEKQKRLGQINGHFG